MRQKRKKKPSVVHGIDPLPYQKGDAVRVYTLMHRGVLKAVMSWRENGRDVRKYRPIEELETVNKEAALRNREARKHGESFGTVSDAEAVALKAYRAYVKEATRNHRKPVPILTMIAKGIEQAVMRTRTPLFSEVVAEYIDHMRQLNRSPRHIDSLRYRLRKFESVFGGEQVGDITPEQVQAAIFRLASSLTATSTTNHRTALYSLFERCVKVGMIDLNPVSRTDAPAIPKDVAPAILTPEDGRRILAHIRQTGSGALAIFTLALFCGPRRAELTRIRRSHINLETRELTITRGIAKRGKARYVEIPANAAAWLEIALGGMNDPEAHLLPGDTEKRRDDAYQKLLAVIKKETAVEIPQNAMRHSAASYMCAVMQDLPRCALQLGHSVDVLNQHYRNVVTSRDGAEWFCIMP